MPHNLRHKLLQARHYSLALILPRRSNDFGSAVQKRPIAVRDGFCQPIFNNYTDMFSPREYQRQPQSL
jgi:hypothetical protein